MAQERSLPVHVTMNPFDKMLVWLRKEIPAYLDKCGSAPAFASRFNKDCASFYWYQAAVEMAILKWPSHRKELEKLRANST